MAAELYRLVRFVMIAQFIKRRSGMSETTIADANIHSCYRGEMALKYSAASGHAFIVTVSGNVIFYPRYLD